MMNRDTQPNSPRLAVPPPSSLPAWWGWVVRNGAVLGIFIACLLPEAVLLGADLGFWGQSDWRIWAWQHGGFWVGLLGNWRPNYAAQPWLMFITYGFLHGGPMHFALNMLTLWSLGPPLVDRMGNRRFLVLYALSLLGGALGFALLSRIPQPMVGASGALFGLAGAHLGLAYQHLRRRQASMKPLIRAVAGLVALNILLWWAMHGMLAWETHLGGFIAGWIAVRWLDPLRSQIPGSNPEA